MTDSEAAASAAAVDDSGVAWDDTPPGDRARPDRTVLHLVRPEPRNGARRALNVVAAAVLLLFSAPVALVIAILIRLTSRGPVLYRQTRVGLDQRHSGMRRDDPRR